ncbi:MAG TPA: DUF1501 domain-containing protein [Urbifossiella sp.]|nr:DUF1501 domain-containing protein [Urbifossiella sp.]
MLSILGKPSSRREVLRVGGLAVAGLTMADVLRAQAAAPATVRRTKSVIMIWLRGGPSHIDSYDMKPDAPAEVRGEFKPIATSVPGIRICEYMPKQAAMMDKLAILRGYKAVDIGDHTPHYILTGFPDRGKRPVLGSIVSRLQPSSNGLPPYVSLMYKPPGLYDNEGPTYLGPAHRPFAPRAEGLANLRPTRSVPLERLGDRRQLLGQFDRLNRAIEFNGNMSGIDSFRQRAMEMIASPKVRDAFDLKLEPPGQRERYGKFCESFLMARRLVEAGIAVVTAKVGDWDTHEKNFKDMREQLPQLDKGFHALVTDLHERGLANDVAVVLWGEFGRAPRISRGDGRDHWPEAGAAVLAGGGFRTGQVIGETDAHGGRSRGKPYTPSNVLATIYGHLGIDPAITLPDHNNRPMYILDDREPVRELQAS